MNTVPLQPKTPGSPLKVIILGRTATENQEIEHSLKNAEDYLRRVHDGPVEIRKLDERASGMVFDRPTIREAQALIGTRYWDLVLVENLARICRNPRFLYQFIEDCTDAGTRVIAIEDNVDTADGFPKHPIVL